MLFPRLNGVEGAGIKTFTARLISSPPPPAAYYFPRRALLPRDVAALASTRLLDMNKRSMQVLIK